MKKRYEVSEELNRSGSFVRVLLVYLLVCVIGVFVMISAINLLIKEHDKSLTTQICGLVAEKMNNSIKYMTTSAENMSALLSAEDHANLEELYEELRDTQGGGYISMGFVDENGRIYATETELGEFDKWDLMDTAELASPVSISAPYRSGLTGQPVFTLFSDMEYGGGKKGKLFLTYPLKEVQNIAYTEILDDESEIWLMDAESDNIIQCAGSNKYAIGSWANALLTFSNKIDPEDQDAYKNWKKSMENHIRSDAVVYHIGDVSYTQVYSEIDFMHGWNVVVRIPSSSMSSTMENFRTIVLVFTVMLLTATMVMFWISHKRDVEDKMILENLSIHDPLTGAMNRRAFDIAVKKHFEKSLKPDSSLLFIDIDYFKTVNDKYGHDAGDTVLTEFTALLKELFGENALIARYGGDEFLVFIKETSRSKTEYLLSELKRRVHEIRPAALDNDDMFKVSCSCGAAQYPDDSRDIEGLKSCADAALYEVKESGRDGFKWYDSSLK